MTREEARLILQSCRLGGQDAADPQFARALALAKEDPELAAWFAQQQKFDALVGNSLRQVRAPAHLKAEILALGISAGSPAESPISIWWRSLFSWTSPVSWVKAAAVVVPFIVVILGLVIYLKGPGNPGRFADFSGQMVQAALNDQHHLDVEASDMKQAVAWLGTRHSENHLVLPAALNGGGLMGCRVLDWHGQKVSMLCYMLHGSTHVDLFVAEAGIFSDAPPPDKPQFASRDGMPTASWSHDGKAYLLVSHGDEATLERLLSPSTAAEMLLPSRAYAAFARISGVQKYFLE
jgi:anti-sigma factor RsiW